jgi:gentisate 1,2-dioxygenase
MEEFYRDLESKSMDALWRQNIGAPTSETVEAPYEPRRWRWKDLEPMIWRAGELVEPGPDAERRVIQLRNPSVGGRMSPATHTLTLAVQLVYPGEVAPSHRHTPTAIRFMLKGEPTTLVDGEPIIMRPGDLVLTPNWTWHGHYNDATEPAIWIDNLDVPTVAMLRASIHEGYPEDTEPVTKLRDESFKTYGAGHLKPLGVARAEHISPLHSYPWAQTEQALHELATVTADPFDDIALEYTNPTTGGHVLPTLACQIQMLRPGVHTMAHRHSTSAIHHVFKGHGHTIVDGVQMDWEEGDFFSLPPWAVHEHVNGSKDKEAVIYSSTDIPIFESLGLLREYAYGENGGYQEVAATYEERYG